MLILNYKLCFSFLRQNGPQISAQHNRLVVSWALLSHLVTVSDYFPERQLPSSISLPTSGPWGLLSSCLRLLPPFAHLSLTAPPPTHRPTGECFPPTPTAPIRVPLTASPTGQGHFLVYFPPLETTSSPRQHVRFPRLSTVAPGSPLPTR